MEQGGVQEAHAGLFMAWEVVTPLEETSEESHFCSTERHWTLGLQALRHDLQLLEALFREASSNDPRPHLQVRDPRQSLLVQCQIYI